MEMGVFIKGQQVQLTTTNDQASPNVATVIRPLKNNKFLVEYPSLTAKTKSNKLRVVLDFADLRPIPPKEAVKHTQEMVVTSKNERNNESHIPAYVSGLKTDMATQQTPSGVRSIECENQFSSSRNMCRRTGDQSTSNKTYLPSDAVLSTVKNIRQSYPKSNAGDSGSFKKARGGDGTEPPTLIRGCQSRGIATDAQYDISLSSLKGKKCSEDIGFHIHDQWQKRNHDVPPVGQSEEPLSHPENKLSGAEEVNNQMEKVLNKKRGRPLGSGNKRKSGTPKRLDLGLTFHSKGPEDETVDKEITDLQRLCTQLPSHTAEKQQPLALGLKMCSAVPSDNRGVSHDNQHLQNDDVTSRDASMGSLGLPKSANKSTNLILEESTTTQYQCDNAIENERAKQVVVVPTSELPSTQQDGRNSPTQCGSLPFIKSFPFWETIEASEVFRILPQQPHFHSIKQYNEESRESFAIGKMLNFANLVERTSKATLEEPRSVFVNKLNALADLEKDGFTVHPIRTRLEELLRIKDRYVQLDDMSKTAKREVTDETREMEKLQESITQLKMKLQTHIKEKEMLGFKLAELLRKADSIQENIQGSRLDFDGIVASPLGKTNSE